MYVKSTIPSAKREVQKKRSAKRDDRIARPRRAQTCAQWECARKAGRFFFDDIITDFKTNSATYNTRSF